MSLLPSKTLVHNSLSCPGTMSIQHFPTIATHLPSRLRVSSHLLKVRVPDTWAQSLQMYESLLYPPTFAIKAIHLNRVGEIKDTNIATKGTSFDLAMGLWGMWFEKRAGPD